MAEWDRLDGEPAKAFAAFAIYRDLPAAQRSLNAAYTLHQCAAEQIRAPGFWADWSSSWRWPERAAAYDAHLDAERRRAREAGLRELEIRRLEYEIENQERLQRRVQAADRLLDELAEWLRTNDGQGSQTLRDGAQKSLSGYARLLKEANETARQAIVGVRDGVAAEGDKPASGAGGTFEWIKPQASGPESEPQSDS